MNAAPAPRLRVLDGDDDSGDVARLPPRGLQLMSATTLMDTTFAPPKWAVPGIICEGVTLLAGPPKVGKSWLSLAMGLAVASGGKAFGKIPVRAGPVLYLALEDTARRLQSRTRKLLDGDPAPSRLSFATESPTLAAGGDRAIAAWLDANPDARLVILDVFAKMRGPAPMGMSAYDADYAAVGRAKAIADHYNIAVVLVHHVRKAGSDDFLAEVSGTNGIAGAADATLVLKRARGQADGVLHVTGRDVDESEHALRFNADNGHWLMLDGQAADHALPESRSNVLRYLRTAGGSTPKQIAEGTGIKWETVKKTCQRMHEDGQLDADGAGRYSAPGPQLDLTVPTSGVPGVPPVPAVPEGL